MVQRTENWSKNWKSSKNPSKQRKYRDNAPLHVKDKMISANLNEILRDELGVRTLTIVVGDRAKIMRGDDKGTEGIVSKIDRKEEKIYINNVDRQRTDGTVREKPFHPSNLQLQALNLSDSDRIEKYDIDDLEAIEVEDEELDELEEDEENEMMQRMQAQSETDEDEDDDDDDDDDEGDEEEKQADEDKEEEEQEESKADPEEIVDGTVDEVKQAVKDGADPEKLLEAEKSSKDRKTLKKWLKSQTEEE